MICDCMATIHTLAANCLYCGKVNCQQECGNVGGSDKAACCSFCKQPLFSNTQKRMGNGRRSTSSAARSSTPATYRAKLTGVQRHGSIHHTDIRSAATPLAQHLNQESTDDKQLAAAQSFRDRLLAADKSAAEQTHIHDVTEDYEQVSSDIWLTPEERAVAMRVEQEFMRRKEEEKRTKRITIDLDSREIITAPSADVIKEDWRRTHRKQTTGGGSIAAVLGEENDHVPVYRRSFPTDAHQTAANQRAPTNAVIGVLQDDAFIK